MKNGSLFNKKNTNTSKKIIAFLLAAVMVLTLASCGSNSAEVDKNIQNLLDQGFVPGATSMDDEEVRVMFQKEETGEYTLVICKKTSALEKAYNALDIFDDDYDKQMENFAKSLKPSELIDVNAYMPTEEEIEDTYEGKAIGTLEEDGFFQTGRWTDEDGIFVFLYDNDIVEVRVEPEVDITEETIDDYSENQIRKMLIDDIEIYGPSSNIITGIK